MGFLDELKDKPEGFGERAKEGLGAAKDKTEEVIGNVKDRFDGDYDTRTLSDESVGYAGRGSRGHQGGRCSYSDSARSSFEDASAAVQDNAEGIGEPSGRNGAMLHRRSTRPSAPKRRPKTVRPIPCDRSPHIVDRTSTRALDDPLRVTFWHSR